MSVFSIPDNLPKEQYPRTALFFKDYLAFTRFFDRITVEDIKYGNMGYSYSTVKSIIDSHASSDINSGNTSWFGDPIPSSVQDALERNSYQKMAEYKKVYDEIIYPRIQEIVKKSEADFNVKKLRYNDLGIGVFDFNKASAGLAPKYEYYSIVDKRIVKPGEVETYLYESVYKYRLRGNGGAVVLVPVYKKDVPEELLHEAYIDIYEGENPFEVTKKYGLKMNSFYSSIKKVYLSKENVPKPKSAVRVFCYIGGDCSKTAEELKWNGYAAIGIAEILQSLGYSVNIVGIIGVRNTIKYKGSYKEGTRYYTFNIKPFSETLDSSKLLYVLSDATFFRIKIFDYIIKSSQYNEDELNSDLGFPVGFDEVSGMVYNQFGVNDGLYSGGKANLGTDFLYYILAGVYSEKGLNELLLKISLEVVEENRKARERLGYVSMYERE